MSTEHSQLIKGVHRLVVKVGTRLVLRRTPASAEDRLRLNTEFLSGLAGQLKDLHARGMDVVLVVSGAVGLGRRVLGWEKAVERVSVERRQAAAAAGQPELMHAYLEALQAAGMQAAQILLTAEDMSDRARYLRIRNTMEALLEAQVIPVINENDTVSVEGVTFGENDRLAAIVAAKIHADALVFLSDEPGLYTADPKRDPEAQLIPLVRPGDEVRQFGAGAGGSESRGGMQKKLAAAQMAIECGIPVMIADGREERVVSRLLEGEALGTFFLPAEPMGARKVWIATAREPAGRLVVDEGARQALLGADGASLLPIGIVEVEGQFHSGDLVEVLGPDRRVIGRGIVNYASPEIRKIKRLHSREVPRLLGHAGTEEVIHRDNMVVIEGGNDRGETREASDRNGQSGPRRFP